MTCLLQLVRYLASALYGTIAWNGRDRHNNESKASSTSENLRAPDSGKAGPKNGKLFPGGENVSSDEPYELEDDYWKEVISQRAKADERKP